MDFPNPKCVFNTVYHWCNSFSCFWITVLDRIKVFLYFIVPSVYDWFNFYQKKFNLLFRSLLCTGKEYIFRLYTSPKYKVNDHNVGLPKRIVEFQRSNIDEITNNRLNNCCHLDECNEANQNDEANGKL